MNKRRRVKHFDAELDAHLLTFSCFHRYPLLGKKRTCQWFVQALDKARLKTSVGRRAINYLRKHAPQFLRKLMVMTGNKMEYHFWQALDMIEISTNL